MEEFFKQVAEVIMRVNLNQSVNQEKVTDIQADYATLEKAKKLIALACKKQDEDLRTMRNIKGADYAKSVSLHRKPKESTKNVDPLSALLGELSES